jgi:hypothetical protein
MESTKRKNSDAGSSPNKKAKTAQEATQIPPIQTLPKLRVPLYQTTDPNEPYHRSPKKALPVASNTMEQLTTEAGAMEAAEEPTQAPENGEKVGDTEVAESGVAAVPIEYMDMTRAELRTINKGRGLKVAGTKQELADQLREYDEAKQRGQAPAENTSGAPLPGSELKACSKGKARAAKSKREKPAPDDEEKPYNPPHRVINYASSEDEETMKIVPMNRLCGRERTKRRKTQRRLEQANRRAGGDSNPGDSDRSSSPNYDY